MKLAADFITENRQNVALLEDADKAASVVTSDEVDATGTPVGAVEKSLRLLDRERNFAAGRGQLLSLLPNTVAREMRGYLDTIRSNVAFRKLLDIKKSGAGLGALSGAELNLLESSIASLDQGQHPDVLRASLERVKQGFRAVQQAIQADLDRYRRSGAAFDPHAAARQNVQPQIESCGRRLRFNIETGRVEPKR